MHLIKKYEGCRLKAYKCPAGKWTIGYGSTYYINGDFVKEGDVISQAYADKLLFEHMKEFNDILPQKLKNKITKKQYDAVISLVYNIGTGAFLRSSLYKAIMNDDYKMICKNWDWYSANGKVLKGLIKRRTEELALFCEDI
ncbi:MAG: putative endolysin [Prokaryotic dsDNA virus sp.]|nr:MAG: putative endolysin [Prokaryotic dsDNA virus sp.]